MERFDDDRFDEDRFEADRFDVERFEEDRFDDERFERLGTFAPFSRASFRPIAIACFRLLTFRPLPLFSGPRLRRRIALSTDLPALRP